ncbi:TlpA family protein disulfide reductase [Zeaxanthinibacter enoshimensis]|uniref:Thiol-disulfide isomerase/thioredoxin n=1 Tax=Zeaxanthinibacter enoshimensis TaxID=392009 RepID=A0A4R6TN37_9FLAO|nr:TlpA disulfide reductase family protein [Zeaxanthinibacter enoshimensis]TDQ32655.1 thiol-disulfide isomerase/thioredoxin [Zeaxanthinibacter enoshimensis]
MSNKAKDWIFYGLLALVALGLYASGKHTEVIGFAQRGLLATGVLNPSVETRKNEGKEELAAYTKADGNLLLRDTSGKLLALEELQGKTVFLNLWATWCPPCIAEMPSIAGLYEEMGDEVVFILLSQDRNFRTAIDFMDRKGYEMPIYELAAPLPEQYQTGSIPSTFVIDKHGNLVMQHRGMADYNTEDFKNFLKSLE